MDVKLEQPLPLDIKIRQKQVGCKSIEVSIARYHNRKLLKKNIRKLRILPVVLILLLKRNKRLDPAVILHKRWDFTSNRNVLSKVVFAVIYEEVNLTCQYM